MEFIVNLSCADRPGLVRSVSGWLYDSDCNILDSDQFRDPEGDTFFMRIHFEGKVELKALNESFESIAADAGMNWQIWDCAEKSRVLILVSKHDHCLIDLMYRQNQGELPIDVALIASNHRDVYGTAAREDIDFLHLPTPGNKTEQEAKLIQEIDARKIDFVVLARYMQIMTPDFCLKMAGRMINIHHSFLPGFKGARPYHQASERGVKLIGATAHFVTADLDEGPIIEQDVERVDHRSGASELAAVGRDVERIVLAKAVRYMAEHRVLLNGNRTVVFQ